MIIKKAEKKEVVEVNPYDWPENYYMETSPEKRKAILEAQDNPEEAELNKLRMELWNKRYGKTKKGEIKDCFLAAWLDILLTITQVDAKFGRKAVKRQVVNALEQLCIPDVEKYGKELLLAELKHTVLLYCCTSMEDRQYSAIIFGLGRMKTNTINKKLAAELYNVGTYIPAKLELMEEAALLSEAVELAKEHFGLE